MDAYEILQSVTLLPNGDTWEMLNNIDSESGETLELYSELIGTLIEEETLIGTIECASIL